MCKSKTIATENVNLYVLNQKLHEFAKSNGVSFSEKRAHLKWIMLNQEVLHFPIRIPVLAACVLCDNGKYAVFSIMRKKYAFIPADTISSMTDVKDSFEIGKSRYIVKDTINGFERYKRVC